MKRIHLTICLVLLTFLMASCVKEEPFSPAGDATPIELRVVADNFVSPQGATRTSDIRTETDFTDGDQMGIFAVSATAGILDKNIPYRYNGTAWVPVNTANTVHSYESYPDDVTYFAYYPYSATMDDATSEDDIQAKFTPKSDQSTHDNYTASDLMTGVGTLSTTGDTRTLTFKVKHRMARLVLHPDANATCVAPAGAGYEYYAEVRTKGIISNITINNIAAWDTGDDMDGYSVLVKPSEMDIHLKYQLGSTTTEYTFTSQTLTAGMFFVFKLGHPAITVEREVQIGDYYYYNGKLMPGANGEEPVDAENCLGVVFHVGPGPDDILDDYKDTGLFSKGKIHGYVVALIGLSVDISDYNNLYYWSSKEGRVGTYTSSTSFQGYTNTQMIMRATSSISPKAAELAVNYLPPVTGYSPPSESSGWYLGSVGQYMSMGPNLSKINNSLKKAGGKTLESNLVWTSTELLSDAVGSAYLVGFTNKAASSYGMKKTMRHATHNRSVLTF